MRQGICPAAADGSLQILVLPLARVAYPVGVLLPGTLQALMPMFAMQGLNVSISDVSV